MRVLLTAFEPYGDWDSNSSWLTLIELLKQRPSDVDLVTRRYPVDLEALQKRLNGDLDDGFDAILHTGQAPGATHIKLESIALNVAGCVENAGGHLPAIVPDAPLAFRSAMPLADWSSSLVNAGIPASISYHAGTFLCNATMYLSHLWCYRQGINRPIGFVHFPLTSEQSCKAGSRLASLPTSLQAEALRIMLRRLADRAAQARQERLA